MGASASSPKTARRSLFSRGEKKPPSPAPAPAAEDKGDRRGSFDSSMPSPSLQPKVPEFAKHHEAVCDRSPESPPRGLLLESREEATEKMLQLILCDRHESALFEHFLHGQYRVELYYFLRACESFEAFAAKCISMSPDESRKGVMGQTDNHHALAKGTEVYETYLTPSSDYCVPPAPAHATIVAQRLDNGAVPVTLFQIPKAAVARTLATEYLELFADWIQTDEAKQLADRQYALGSPDRRQSDATDTTAFDETYAIDRFGNRVRRRDSTYSETGPRDSFKRKDSHDGRRRSSAFRESFQNFRDSFKSTTSSYFDPSDDEPAKERGFFGAARRSYMAGRSQSREAQPNEAAVIRKNSSFRADDGPLPPRSNSSFRTDDGRSNSSFRLDPDTRSSSFSTARHSSYSDFSSQSRDSLYDSLDSCDPERFAAEYNDDGASPTKGRGSFKGGAARGSFKASDRGSFKAKLPPIADPPTSDARNGGLKPVDIPRRGSRDGRRFSDAKPNLEVFLEAKEDSHDSPRPSRDVMPRRASAEMVARKRSEESDANASDSDSLPSPRADPNAESDEGKAPSECVRRAPE